MNLNNDGFWEEIEREIQERNEKIKLARIESDLKRAEEEKIKNKKLIIQKKSSGFSLI